MNDGKHILVMGGAVTRRGPLPFSRWVRSPYRRGAPLGAKAATRRDAL